MKPGEDNRIFVIAGPTASGKTRLAVEFAESLGGEVIGADSVQLYRRLNIGSAKPNAEEMRGIRHYVIDVAELDEAFDAARYARMAEEALREIRARGRVPIIAGGTGLYIRALIRGMAAGIPSQPEIRQGLNARAAQGEDALRTMHAELAQVDPVYAAKIHPGDAIRIVRGLEVHAISGEGISVHHARHAAEPSRYDALIVALEVDRAVLRSRIELRTKAMIEQGFRDEVRGILDDGYDPGLKPLRSVGYAEMVRHVTHSVAMEDTEREITTATMAFAKRQRTWFRGQEKATWVTPEELGSAHWRERVRTFLRP